jgi:hypothetical protein
LLVLGGLFCGVLALSACDSGGEEATIATDQVLNRTTLPPLDPARRDAVLAAGVLRAGDLPSEWSEQPFGSDKSLDIDTITALASEDSCKKLTSAIFNVEGIKKSNSSPWQSPDGRVMQNSITTFDKSSQADKLVSGISRVDPNDCLAAAFDKAFKGQQDKITGGKGTISQVRVRKVPLSTTGDFTTAFEITVDVKDGSNSRTIKFTRVAIEAGPTVLDFSLRTENAPFPNIPDLVKPVVDRVNQCVVTGACV